MNHKGGGASGGYWGRPFFCVLIFQAYPFIEYIMPNALDTFFDKGNTWFANLANDTITWDGDDYAGTVSDLNKDLFFDDDGAGKKRNAERLLEFAVSVFSSSLPAIGDTITYLTDTYQIIEIESQDTTNIVYRIRQKMGAAT